MSLLEKALEKSKKDESLFKKNSEASTEKTDKEIVLQNNEVTEAAQISTPIENNFDEDSLNKEIVQFNWGFLRSKGFIQLDQSHLKIAEEYRSIKRPLVSNALGKRKNEIENANLILITSSIPNEGKTFTAINLAFSIVAEMDKKVLLIDADVAKPSISKTLGFESKLGLIDYLESSTLDLSDVIRQTEIAGLRIIPAGKSHKLSTELLASDKMVALSKELSERYSDRVVIFDTPPLLATTQAEVLASQMGQIILVVAAETTSQHYVMESVKKLQSCSDVVFVLLNKAQRTLNAGYYGYGQY